MSDIPVSGPPGTTVQRVEVEVELRPIVGQVAEMIPHLKVGSYYLFEHVKKGPFVAKFVGTLSRPDDVQDPIFLELELITDDGSGQARLAFAKTRDGSGNKITPPTRDYRCRPSWLRTITTPSTSAQQLMAEQWQALQNTPAADNVFSLPTVQALSRIDGQSMDIATEDKKPGRLKRLFGGRG